MSKRARYILHKSSLNLAFLMGSAAVLFPQSALQASDDLPVNGIVIAGQAAIGVTGNDLLVEQSSHNAIIEWGGFSIGADHSVVFQNGSGATLNRVIGSSISSIDGNLSATGSLFLINANGVIIGEQGVIETGGSFVASTLDISNADFLDGGSAVFAGGSNEAIVNLGKVSALGGDVAFIAHTIVDEGEVRAPNGTAALVAGREVLMRDGALDDGKFVVRIGDADSTITEAGLVNAASVELRANGGNIYALAGNAGGSINATGISNTGARIFLTAPGGKVTVKKQVTAKRGGAGGDIVVEANDVLIAGLMDMTGAEGMGGTIDIGGRDIVLAGADMDASGGEGGGRIRVGGEYRGGKGLSGDEVQNAETLSVDQASVLRANGTGANADGGTIIAWADDTTSFAGHIDARGTANGGFAEVSGKTTLNYTGLADLRGGSGTTGTLLLDPTDYIIDAVEAATIIANLGGANVTISTDPAGGGNGDIIINSALNYASANDLTLLAHRHVAANASIQNADAGDINLVAGWDGATGFDLTTYNAADLSAQTLFGNGGGSVLIGNGSQTAGIEVGSRNGATRVYADDLNLTGGSATKAHAQLGFRATDQGLGYTINGAISARLTGGIAALGSNSASRAYAQIGHVGIDEGSNAINEATVNAPITIEAQGDLTFLSGTSQISYAQLGHGGNLAKGNYSGDITIVSARDLTFTAKGDLSYAQLGHGGDEADGNHSGAIAIGTVRDLSFAGGSGFYAFAQLGHGGGFSGGNIAGNITIASARDLSFAAGTGNSTYVQLGHGSANVGHFAYVGGTRTGDININASGEISAQGGASAASIYNYGWIGHSTDNSFGITNANMTLKAAGFDLSTGSAVASGGGSVFDAGMLAGALKGGNVTLQATDSSLGFNGAVNYDSAKNLLLMASHDLDFADYGIQNANATGGNITLVAGWDGATAYDQAAFDAADLSATTLFGNHAGSVKIGDGGQAAGVAVGSRMGATRVYADDLNLTGSSVADGYAQLGFRASDLGAGYAINGGLHVRSAGSIVALGGDGDGSYAQIGHVGADRTADGVAEASVTAAISVETVGDLALAGGAGSTAYAELGHGGDHALGNYAGSISVLNAHDLNLTGGTGAGSFVQIGHGGAGANGNQAGDITLASIHDLTLKGGAAHSFAQLGHGSADIGDAGQATGSRQGDIAITASGEISVADGVTPAGNYNFGWIGHASKTANALSNADVSLRAASFDRSSVSAVAVGANGAVSGAMLANAAQGGDVSLVASNSGLALEGAAAYSAPHQLLLQASNAIVLNAGATIANAGSGNIILAAGTNFHNDTGSVTPLTTSGRWLVYSTRPDLNRNDIEITNRDFLRFATAYDAGNPVPAGFAAGSGLIYQVAPVLQVDVPDQTIVMGEKLAPTSSIVGLTVNGLAVDPAAFGLDVASMRTPVTLSAAVQRSPLGYALPGFYAGGLVAEGVASAPYWGMSVATATRGDLNVKLPKDMGGPRVEAPVITITPFDPPLPTAQWLGFKPASHGAASLFNLSNYGLDRLYGTVLK